MKIARILPACLFLTAFPMLVQAQGEHADHSHHAVPIAATSSASSELALQLEAVRRATERYREHSLAVAEGFRLFGAEGPLMGEHWYHPDRVMEPLDLARPSTLQYATVDGERVLIGVAYTVYQRPGESLPEGFVGTDDHWHVHDVERIARGIVADRPILRWIVDRRARSGKLGAGDGRTQLVMLHAWVWSNNPSGVFAQEHPALPYLRAGLSVHAAPSADTDAARGIALLAPAACDDELRRFRTIASLSRSQRSELMTRCEGAVNRIRAVVAAANGSHETMNAGAAASWRGYAATRDSLLTDAQKTRIAALESATMH